MIISKMHSIKRKKHKEISNKIPIFIYRKDHARLVSMCRKNESYADKFKEFLADAK